MNKKPNLIIVIPARSNSKRIKNKNLIKLGKLPLLGHKIKSCINSKVGKVYVSTDSIKIANYAKKLGAKVPFLRPKKYADDKSTDYQYLKHFFSKMNMTATRVTITQIQST